MKLFALALAALACHPATYALGDAAGIPADSVAYYRTATLVAPMPPTAAPGDTIRLEVSLTKGATVRAVTPAWRSSNTRVATVDSAGRITAVGTGDASVTATVLGKAVVVVVHVRPRYTLAFLQHGDSLRVGSAHSYPIAITRNGTPVPSDSATYRVGAALQLAGPATARGVAPGIAYMVATAFDGRAADSVRVVVVAPTVYTVAFPAASDSLIKRTQGTYTAVLTTSDGTPITTAPSFTGTGGLTITAVGTTATVTATQLGTQTLTASWKGATATMAIRVTTDVAQITITGLPDSLTVGDSVLATIHAFNAAGDPVVPDSGATWTGSPFLAVTPIGSLQAWVKATGSP